MFPPSDDTRHDLSHKTISGDSRDALLVEIRERYDYAADGWREIQDEGDTDMRYVSGDPWDPKDRADRTAAGRPCLALDELGQYYNQLINDIRANPIAIKFAATGNGATPKGAEFYADKTREIEYRSHAQVAYTTAFENAVQRSYGWARVTTGYAHERTDEQDLSIDDVPDPSGILADPDAKRPDSSDVQYLFAAKQFSEKEFRRRWPKARIRDFTGDIARLAPSFIKGERITVAEYWAITTRPRKLALFKRPDNQLVKLFEDEAIEQLPAQSIRVRALRDVDYPSVCQYLTNGVEILEENDWAGKYIPFASCFGKVLYLKDGGVVKRRLISMTRLARDPYMLYCYIRTCEAEAVGGVPRNAWIGYKGQFAGNEAEWQRANHEPVAYLEARAITEATGPQVLPLPQRQPWDPPLQNLEMAAEAARRAIQAAMMGSPLPTDAQRLNQKSGVALAKIQQSGQKGSFHFVDHYKDMIRHIGVIVEDLLTPIYDTARDVGTRKANEDTTMQRINDPTHPESISTQGDYLVTVSTGPSDDSTREAASDFADTIVGSPQIAQVVGPQKAAELIALAIRLKNVGPMGDEMANIISPKPDDQGSPQALQQQAGQLTHENAQLKAQLQQASDLIKTEGAKEQAKQQGVIQKAQIDGVAAVKVAQLQVHLQAMKDASAIAVAKINALTKGVVSDNEQAIEAIALEHEAQQADQDRAHEAAMAAMDHAHTVQQAQQGQAHALAQGAQGHDQALEQQAQAGSQQAALAQQQADAQSDQSGGA